MFSYLKFAAIGAVVLFVVGLYWYISDLQNTVKILEENNLKLEFAVTEQQKLIAQQKQDTQNITTLMKNQQRLTAELNKSLVNLNEKFHKVNANGVQRDIGTLGHEKPKLVQNIINKNTTNTFRCFELITGGIIGENEKNEDCPLNVTNGNDASSVRPKADRTTDATNRTN